MTDIEKLPDYQWDTRYSSATHDLIKEFFVPALSRSRFYYRIAGFFSSTSIAAAVRGISAFVENGEKMYLIIGGELTKEDVDAINNGLENMDDIFNKKWEECKEEFTNNVIKKRFEMLAWLIANDKLEIKIGVNKSKSGEYLPPQKSLFHEKILIFEDYEGNRIQVDGSINETWKAWKENRESFCVHKSWISGNEEFIRTAKEEFDKVWLNLDNTCEVIDLPEALKNNLISIRPKNKPRISEEVDFSTEELEEINKKEKKELRKYQEEAVKSWKDNGYVGLFEMATGTGKTFTALKAIETLNLKKKVLIIVVPQRELATQWADECENIFDGYKKRIILCFGETEWKNNISRIIRQSQREESLCIIISVVNTMRSEYFIKKVEPIFSNSYLIIDEVHEMGSKENMKLLPKLVNIKRRIGLSATPERAWDEEGNKAIQDFFNVNDEPTFKWDMEKAINPPKGYERCLSPYKYYIHETNLTDEELEDYTQLSLEISKKFAILSKGGKVNIKNVESEPSLQNLLFKRANIIKKCENKLNILDSILNKYGESLTKCIVYCNDEKHMDAVTRIIIKKGYNCRKFYGVMDKYERENVFQSFSKEGVQFLVAIKCLDQGIDLPICNSAIILTSSTNPREYVQRRGRILRLHKEKEYAIVHDILVFPYNFNELVSGKVRISEFEGNILKSQLGRIDIFIENSLNKSENYLKKLNYGEIIINSNKNG